MKKFCASLREHVKNIIHFVKKKMIPLTNEELNSHEDARVCYICRKYFLKEIIVITQGNTEAVHSISNLKFNVPNEIPAVFHNGSKYDYHYIIKQLANEF